LSFGAGGSVLNMTPGASQAVQSRLVGANNTVTRGGTGTALITGTGLGGTVGGSNTSTINFDTTLPGQIGQNGAVGANNRAILPWLLLETGGTTSFATFSAAGAGEVGLRQLTASEMAVADTLTGNANLLLTAANTAAAGVQTYNSITFDVSGSLAINAGSTVLLDSGGILARVNSVISGSGRGILSGANTFNRELIIQVQGGATLDIGTVASPVTIYSVNGTGLTKGGAGTLSLNTATSYLGNTTVNAGTLRFGQSGTPLSNAMFLPFTTAPGVGGLGSGPSGQSLIVQAGGTVDLNGSAQTFGNLTSAGTLPGTGGTILNSSATAASLRIGITGNGTWAGNISSGTGAINLVKDGGNTWTVVSNNSMSGSLTLQGGQTLLQDSGAFSGVSDVIIRRAALVWNDNGISAAARFNSGADLTLNSGAFVYQARGGTNGTAQIGDLTLAGGSSIITSTPSLGTARLTINSLAGRVAGSTLTFSSAGAPGSNGNIFFTSAPTLANGIIGGWALALGVDPAANGSTNVEFATYESAGGVRLNGTYLTTLANNTAISGTSLENTNVKVGTVTGAASTVIVSAGGGAVNSVTLSGGTSNLLFSTPTDTLTVKSGGVLAGLDNSTRNIGNTANPGRLTAGTGQPELFLHIGQGTLNVNSAIVDNNVALSVVLAGVSQTANNPNITLLGVNTYTGTTYVNGVSVNLNTIGGNAIPGTLIISGGTTGTDSMPIGNSTV
ncbi:MAG: autotransporter-associated beta strand repeat-containing protein, partial [Verrucomicrobiaceae bacterium]|nr:autotransporter-associated beta strand repeat-containing protein [Verrucomicrobiaceae bacterium]